MKIGYAMCGSFCTVAQSMSVLQELAEAGHEIIPIVSEKLAGTDTRFGKAADILSRITEICGREPLLSIVEAEPLGPRIKLDMLVICPCTGNTLAKLACGITDTAVTMSAKAHLRSDRPLLIALATNDAMSANLQNIAALLRRKHIFFVPLRQDDPVGKPHSLVSDFSLIPEAMESAISKGQQLRPLIL